MVHLKMEHVVSTVADSKHPEYAGSVETASADVVLEVAAPSATVVAAYLTELVGIGLAVEDSIASVSQIETPSQIVRTDWKFVILATVAPLN